VYCNGNPSLYDLPTGRHANALRIAQTKQNNTGYQSKAVRLVEYKVRQKQQMVEAKDIEDILDSMYPRGT
jgi:hypothetical protein